MNGKNIKLTAIEPSDIDTLYEWENDTSIWHLSNSNTPYSRFILEQYIINSGEDIYSTKQLRMMIRKTDNDKTIGCIDIFDFDPINLRAGIGILINKTERNKGYASEALELLTNYCFSTLNLKQVYCNISFENKSSLSLFKKLGFTIAGEKKDWIRTKEGWESEYFLIKTHY